MFCPAPCHGQDVPLAKSRSATEQELNRDPA